MDAAAASEQSSVEARATAGNRVRVAKRATAAEEEREPGAARDNAKSA